MLSRNFILEKKHYNRVLKETLCPLGLQPTVNLHDKHMVAASTQKALCWVRDLQVPIVTSSQFPRQALRSVLCCPVLQRVKPKF